MAYRITLQQKEKHARLEAERAFTTDEAARLIQKPVADVRGVLNRLVEAGLVEARGERKGRVWHLSASTYLRLGAKAAYVRQPGFEPLQQEQMVLQYVAKHGRITHHSQGGGGAVPVVAGSSLSATHAADRGRQARTTWNQERSLVRAPRIK